MSDASDDRGTEWLPRAADNLLSSIANGRPLRGPEGWPSPDYSVFADRAREAYRRGAALTRGLRSHAPSGSLVYWPMGVPRAVPVALVSSRIGRNLTPWRAWFEAFRTAVLQVRPPQEILVTAAGTTTFSYAHRAAALFELPVMTIVLPAGPIQTIDTWLAEQLTAERPAEPEAHVSPLLSPSDREDVIPQRDETLVAAAQRLIVLYARPGGSVDRLVRSALADPQRPKGSVRIAVGEGLVSPRLRDDYLSLGAVAWHLSSEEGTPQAAARADLLADSSPAPAPAVMTLDQFAQVQARLARSGNSVLTHCTRRRDGPWPHESHQDYLDRLVLEGIAEDASPLGVLRRIVEQRLLVGAAGMYRGAGRAVSFSQVPLARLLTMRAFRPHRGTWAFEPYGICVTQTALQELGARPVYYGDDHLWALLTERDRPFFQKRYSTGANGITWDWSVEREWRVIGDLALLQLPADAVWVFVATRSDAERLAPHSPWPVISCQESGALTPPRD